ncbi:MAG: Cell division protein FtsI [Peptidoglycan synthetase] [uncultured Sphingomonadaceae bacterium]|uniref:Cell division protein FtsI [Peptidoglycan synthetase] n=1 Tax=uncultured Sphingomonadaceae bacterium TaxID=169976 RepID=A0A6J4TWD6_9SPHN|nr:MAG: Cell division protein FtsI [Peptidoglycan synthetase] [uncultured Sphingomonadaceae bacterium]
MSTALARVIEEPAGRRPPAQRSVPRVGRPGPVGPRQHQLALTHHRLMLCMLLFAGATAVIGLRLLWLAAFGDHAGRRTTITSFLPERGDIVDRNGVTLARTIEAWTITVHPNKIIGDKLLLAEKLEALMPERSAAEYHKVLTSGSSFAYLKRRALPELVSAVNALGEPGLQFGRERERLYPQTALGAHVLGWTDVDGRGAAGMERVLEAKLSDKATRGTAQALSIDSRVQGAVESELLAAMAKFNAIGATGVVLDVRSGELIALASLPAYNPNSAGRAPADERFNRATLGVYELGSTFKPLTVAAAMDAGVIRSPFQMYPAASPVHIGRFTINDDHPMGRSINVAELLIHSSNIATARVADEMGVERMQKAFRSMGFDARAHVELPEKGKPIWPAYWGRSTLMTAGFGHGVAVSPLHLASAYAAMVNGGVWRPTTLLKREGPPPAGRRIFTARTSERMRQMLRLVVTEGTGKNADAPGYRVGGKTGTAEKPKDGGYARKSLVSTFAAAFPMDDPRYVVIAMLDEPRGNAETFGFATAGWTAAPVVKQVVGRIGPLLGIYPDESREVDLQDLQVMRGLKKAGH